MPIHIPKEIPAVSIADIWNYVTRRLTNLSDVRAALIDNLDALISSRSTLTAVQVWASATRDLTKKILSETSIALDYAGAHAEPETFNDAALHALSTMSTVDPVVLPAGATANNATLLMLASMENYDGVLQTITVTMYFRKAGDPWGVAVAIAQHKFVIPAVAHQQVIVPILAEVGALTADVYEARIDVQASAANRMDYILQGILSPAFIEA